MLQLKAAGLLVLVLWAMLTDLKSCRIGNRLTYSFIAGGMLINVIFEGYTGFAISMAGMLAPLLLLFWLYGLRMLGAGDVKLFAAVGALMGFDFVLVTMAFSFLLGGVVCLGILIVKGITGRRLKLIVQYIRICLLTGSVLDYSNFCSSQRHYGFRFSTAVFPVVIAQLVLLLVPGIVPGI